MLSRVWILPSNGYLAGIGHEAREQTWERAEKAAFTKRVWKDAKTRDIKVKGGGGILGGRVKKEEQQFWGEINQN